MSKIFYKLITIFSILSLLLVSGVQVLWMYSNGTPDSVSGDYFATIEDFYYPENLPDDEDDELNHNSLLEKIISFSEGINGSNTLLSKAIKDRKSDDYDDVCSNQQVSGGNLKNQFSNVDGFENVGFLIYFYSETEYYIFTYDNRETTSTGKYIETFLTKAIYKDGVWVLSGGYQGSAKVIKYDGKTNGPYKNVIDHSTWVRTV